MQKEIYLMPYPFSDFSGQKVRPVIIVSNDGFNQNSRDVIVCGITTRRRRWTHEIHPSDMTEGKLMQSCFIRPESIFKVHKKLLLKKLGVVSDVILQKTKKRILELL